MRIQNFDTAGWASQEAATTAFEQLRAAGLDEHYAMNAILRGPSGVP
jgi:hypothetical protein